MEEIWKDISGYEGLYQVSNLGRVKSLERAVKMPSGKEIILQEKILKLEVCKRFDRRRVTLCKNGKTKRWLMNRLVLETFVGPCPEGMECCHNDGNASNNVITNLRWDTHRNNCLDTIRHGNHVDHRGEKHPTVKLKELEVIEIRRLLNTKKVSQSMISKMFKISYGNVSAIYRRKSWKHLPEKPGGGRL